MSQRTIGFVAVVKNERTGNETLTIVNAKHLSEAFNREVAYYTESGWNVKPSGFSFGFLASKDADHIMVSVRTADIHS